VHHRLPVSAALTTSFYAAPQNPDDARRLFDAGCSSVGLDGTPNLPLRPSRVYGSALVLAREWGLTQLEQRLVSAIEASYEPTWDHERGEFTWGMGLDEPHPRGQFNAFLAAAEAAGPGRWERLSAAPIEACPQVVDVDFPNVALRRAEWIDGVLHLRLVTLVAADRMTGFRVVGVGPGPWEITGLEGANVETTDAGLDVRVPVVDAAFSLKRRA